MGTSPQPGDRPRWWPRIKASLVDYLVIVAWLLVLTALGWVIVPRLPPAAGPQGPYLTDLIVFAMTVFPVWLYLTLTEASRAAATVGKRVAGLRVVMSDAGRAGGARVAARNAVKLVPWQLAHVAVARFMLGVQFEAGLVCYGASLVLAVTTIVIAIRDPRRRGLHDLVAGTRVVAAG